MMKDNSMAFAAQKQRAFMMMPKVDIPNMQMFGNQMPIKHSYNMGMHIPGDSQNHVLHGSSGIPVGYASTKQVVAEENKKPRSRRTFKELNREVICPKEGCTRRYATRSSLATHIRLKHTDHKEEKKEETVRTKVVAPGSPRGRSTQVERVQNGGSPYSRIRAYSSGPKLQSNSGPNMLGSYSMDLISNQRSEDMMMAATGISVASLDTFDMPVAGFGVPSLDSFDLSPHPQITQYNGMGSVNLRQHPMISTQPTAPMHPMMMGMQSQIMSSQVNMASRSRSFDVRHQPPQQQQQKMYQMYSPRPAQSPRSMTPSQSVLSPSPSFSDSICSESPITDSSAGVTIELTDFSDLFTDLKLILDGDMQSSSITAPASKSTVESTSLLNIGGA
eukprot:CFRG1358T1